jgi:transcriptional regulator with XRE-family HTH domain
MVSEGSIVVRRQLGRELRLWRERAHRTLDDVAAARIASVSKIQRIEHGRTSVQPHDVRRLCRLYGVGEADTETLTSLAKATTDPDWWERHDTAAPAWYALYLRLEAVATDLWAFEPWLVHGLFQTRDYALEIERLADPENDREAVTRTVATRMARQRKVFARPEPLRIHLVLGEAALATHVGPADLMTAQLAAVRERAHGPHVDVRVLPFSAGPHPGMRGAFSVLDFHGPEDPAVAYVETYDAALYPKGLDQVARFRRRFEQIWSLAVPLDDHEL